MKNKTYIMVFVVVVMIIIAIFFVLKKAKAPFINSQPTTNNLQQEINNSQNESQVQKIEQVEQLQPKYVDPLPNALSRITKKPFGIFITPKTSPVRPERFSGYHNAIDLETTLDEQNIDMPVKVLCDGKLLVARTASGYGGVAVQSCTLDGKAVTVIYGHINLTSINAKIGDQLKAGDFLANLGKGFSSQTDGERKHLHLSVHKGTGVNILGYVQNKNQLKDWIDPAKYLN